VTLHRLKISRNKPLSAEIACDLGAAPYYAHNATLGSKMVGDTPDAAAPATAAPPTVLRAHWYVHDIKVLMREARVPTKAALSKLAPGGRDTISKVVDSKPVTEAIAVGVFTTLKDRMARDIRYEDYVKPYPPENLDKNVKTGET
jgi:hypothetical protein